MNPSIVQLDATELASWIANSDLSTESAQSSQAQPLLLDVREPWEFELCSIPGSVPMPMGQVPELFDAVSRNQAVVCICHHGIRSQQVALFLKAQGFQTLYNLKGGIHAWSMKVDPSCPTY